jgi:cation:H+ antiporter
VLAVWARFGQREVVLSKEQAVEVSYLALATAYSFVIPLKGTLSLVDTLILFTIFILYIRAAAGRHTTSRSSRARPWPSRTSAGADAGS